MVRLSLHTALKSNGQTLASAYILICVLCPFFSSLGNFAFGAFRTDSIAALTKHYAIITLYGFIGGHFVLLLSLVVLASIKYVARLWKTG